MVAQLRGQLEEAEGWYRRSVVPWEDRRIEFEPEITKELYRQLRKQAKEVSGGNHEGQESFCMNCGQHLDGTYCATCYSGDYVVPLSPLTDRLVQPLQQALDSTVVAVWRNISALFDDAERQQGTD